MCNCAKAEENAFEIPTVDLKKDNLREKKKYTSIK